MIISLRIAIRAFFVILFADRHYYSDGKRRSFVGSPEDGIKYGQSLNEIVQNYLCQEDMLNQAKKILKKKEK